MHVVITGTLNGGPAGRRESTCAASRLGGGVTMTASGVSYVPRGTRTVYTGSVTTLDGQEVIALVTAGAGSPAATRLPPLDRRAGGDVTGTVGGAPAGAR